MLLWLLFAVGWLAGWLVVARQSSVNGMECLFVGGGFILVVVACFAMVDWIRRSRTIEEDGPTLSNYTNFQDRIFGSFIPSTNQLTVRYCSCNCGIESYDHPNSHTGTQRSGTVRYCRCNCRIGRKQIIHTYTVQVPYQPNIIIDPENANQHRRQTHTCFKNKQTSLPQQVLPVAMGLLSSPLPSIVAHSTPVRSCGSFH